MEQIVAQASTVNGRPADLKSIPLEKHEGYLYDDGKGNVTAQKTYGDALSLMRSDKQIGEYYKYPSWSPAAFYGTPAGYQWIQEVAVHQSYPWSWNLVVNPAWQGDLSVPAPRFNRYVQDLDQDGVPDVLERRKRYPGKRRHFFFSRW